MKGDKLTAWSFNEIFAEIQRVWTSQLLSQRTLEHLYMFAIALFFSFLAGVLIGVLTYRNPRFADPIFNSLNIVETIPDIALLVLLLPVFGIGKTPTIVASILYSILPIARNTYTGLSNVPGEHIEIAEALGLTRREILFKIRFPLSLPLIAGGIRIAVVFTMGVVTLGGLIAAGGLGAALQNGIQLYDMGTILVTGIWIGILAVLLDGAAGLIEHILQVRYGK
ncbi:ABC transporter permease [Methanosarcina sp. MSH10X1]|uniref:ABC transporter permease n=1 Tax=Methanosarcina sp. MSH10X1 TaxID=2507075 RepID=UPI001F0C6EE2|nr:ABC transporter permease [Methanosarcina sp. MSH10X1]